jgi:hypothetical protein
MSAPYALPVSVAEPQLPALPSTNQPSFVVGTVTTPFWYEVLATGVVSHGTRVVTTAVDGAQTVQILDAAAAPLVAGTYEVVAAPLLVAVAGGTSSGGSTTSLTDAQLRATPVPVTISGAVAGLTDAQLRATAVPVSGPLTDAQMRATAVPVSGPLTDAQLRATALPVSTAGVVRTPLLQSGVVTAGTVAAGAYEVGFSNDGTTNATVAGGALAPGRSVSFVTHGNDTFAAIAYTASATSALTIVSVR